MSRVPIRPLEEGDRRPRPLLTCPFAVPFRLVPSGRPSFCAFSAPRHPASGSRLLPFGSVVLPRQAPPHPAWEARGQAARRSAVREGPAKAGQHEVAQGGRALLRSRRRLTLSQAGLPSRSGGRTTRTETKRRARTAFGRIPGGPCLMRGSDSSRACLLELAAQEDGGAWAWPSWISSESWS